MNKDDSRHLISNVTQKWYLKFYIDSNVCCLLSRTIYIHWINILIRNSAILAIDFRRITLSTLPAQIHIIEQISICNNNHPHINISHLTPIIPYLHSNKKKVYPYSPHILLKQLAETIITISHETNPSHNPSLVNTENLQKRADSPIVRGESWIRLSENPRHKRRTLFPPSGRRFFAAD